MTQLESRTWAHRKGRTESRTHHLNMMDDLAYPDLEEALRTVERCISVFFDSGSLVTAFHHLNIGISVHFDQFTVFKKKGT